MRRILILPLLLCLAATPTTAPDPAATLATLQKLATQEPPPADLSTQINALLALDKSTIDKNASIIDTTKLKAIDTELASIREKALANIDRLTKGDPITQQKAYYTKLTELMVRQNAANAAKSNIIDALRRREACLTLLRQLDKPIDESANNRIITTAVAALGFDHETALKLPELGDPDEPRSDSPERSVWFYRACRKIEAWNKSTDCVNKWERISAQLLNDYREALGLFPLEIDPRLVLAARQHSKEMTDLKYFGHNSPIAGLEQPVLRMRAAGYNAGWQENICGNVGDAQKAFSLWFGSPGHHQAMTHPGEIAIGVGRWDNAWTHTFGHALRFSTKPPEDREKILTAAAKGNFPTIPPQPDTTKFPPVTVTRTETELKIFDPKDPSHPLVVPGPATGQPKPPVKP